MALLGGVFFQKTGNLMDMENSEILREISDQMDVVVFGMMANF